MPNLPRLSVAAAFLLCGLAAPLCAQETLPGPQAMQRNQKTNQTLRGFTLFNKSSQPIVEAHVTTTRGIQAEVTRFGDIQPEHGQEFRLDADACLAAVEVWLKDGRRLRADNLNDCATPT
jgi:hypothetical protein